MEWLAYVAGIITSTATTVAALWAAFRFFLGKWLDQRFQREMAEVRAAEQAALVRLQSNINTMFGRIVKLHAQEFDALPEAWAKLNEAMQRTKPVAMAFSRTADLDRMDDDELELFLKQSSLTDWDKFQLMKASKKTNYYVKVTNWKALQEAKQAFWAFQTFFANRCIFMPEDFEGKFTALETITLDALLEAELILENSDMPREFEKTRVFFAQETAKMVADLKSAIRARLWVSTTTIVLREADFIPSRFCSGMLAAA